MHNRSIFPGAPRPLLFGHRGCSIAAPENTMESFRSCVDKGVQAIELDIHLCSTGELVVTHDFNVRRVSGYDGVVEQMSFSQLRDLDVGFYKRPGYSGRAQIPLLDEIFEAFGSDLYFDIELKQESIADRGLAKAAWQAIRAFGLEDRCIVSSFNPFAVRSFRKTSKDRVPSAVIYSVGDEVPRILRKGFGRHIAGCGVLKPHCSLITPDSFLRDHVQKRYPIIAWTVDDLDEAERLLELGVDGLVSNDPEKLIGLTAAYRS